MTNATLFSQIICKLDRLSFNKLVKEKNTDINIQSYLKEFESYCKIWWVSFKFSDIDKIKSFCQSRFNIIDK